MTEMISRRTRLTIRIPPRMPQKVTRTGFLEIASPISPM
ncbi:MAG: hypothetical protein A4E73_01110 [Syntrophaceae bacterium PtaU1.Bin231]|nr:MAG: hypothetical protein A4E73_01110 [Syntrophaceae bacterium PtaU1.Bin231]